MKFLIVDPNRTSRDSIARALNAAGHSVIPLQDGQQGLQALAGGHYDCVISELSMPVVGGLEMVRRMRFSADTTPVVVWSAEISDADRALGQGLGIATFLVKPVAPERVVEYLTAAAAHTAAAIA
jgi:DNA-binding response OmpR family regulator